MTRDQMEALIADVLAGHLKPMLAELAERCERMVERKPLPPFVAPPPWTAGRHGAGCVVRHRNGLFSARRDTDGEPGLDDAWLPLVVGVASLTLEWRDDRRMALVALLSDGSRSTLEREFDLPIVRGYWEASVSYRPGDRVFRFGEWHASAASAGIDPTTDDGAHWLKVNGKQARGVSFKLDDDGTLFEGGREVGSLKPMVAALFAQLTGSQRHG